MGDIADADGNCDVSPKGDPPGFTLVLDDATIVLPERPGNRSKAFLRSALWQADTWRPADALYRVT